MRAEPATSGISVKRATCCWNDVRGKVSCYVCITPMVPTIRCRALEYISAVVLDSVHEARDSDETALIRDVVDESRAGASGCQGGGEESVLLETAAVGVTITAERIAPAIDRDEAPMPHGAPAARGDELEAEQSVPLPAGGSVSSELEGRDDSGDTEAKEVLVKRVKAAIESGDQNLLCAPDDNGFTLLHDAACYGLVDSVQQLIKAGGKKLLFATNKDGRSALHYAYDHVEASRLLIEAGGKMLLLMTDLGGHSALHAAAGMGHVECMRQLIEAGGMQVVPLRDKEGRTALHLAADKGHEAALGC